MVHRRSLVSCLLVTAGLLVGCSDSGSSQKPSNAAEVVEPSIAAAPAPLPSIAEAGAERRVAAQPVVAPAIPVDLGYRHAEVTKTAWGRDGEQFWIFEPAGPTPEAAPVVVFLHGWAEMNPRSYGAWVDHLVRQGNTIVFPRYQAGVASNPATFTGNTVTAVRRAFEVLETGADRVRPDLDRVAVVGHSMGGLLAANLAALAHEHDLPVFRAVMAVQPGVSGILPLVNLNTIPRETLLVAMAGDEDRVTGSSDAIRIYEQATSVPLANRLAILLRSDARGEPPFIADHMVPLGTLEAYNAMHIDVADDGEKFKLTLTDLRKGAFEVTPWDYHAFWRPFDELLTLAFSDDTEGEARRLSTVVESLPRWSDGVAVRAIDLVTLTAGAHARNTADPE